VRRRLEREWLVATPLAVLGAAYVLTTNAEATPGVILLHVGILWLLTPPLMTLALRVDARLGRRLAPAAREVAARWLALSVAATAMLVLVAWRLDAPIEALLARGLATALVPLYVAYALVAAWTHLGEARTRALRAELAQAQAQVAALNARLRPHFLFNTLNCLEELALADPPAASALVRDLARVLRGVIEASDALAWPFASELALARSYLAIERARVGARLRVTLPTEAELGAEPLAVLVPATILLTLAENALKHGLEAEVDVVDVTLAVRPDREARALHVALENPAPARPVDKAGFGLGLRDVRARLALAYGDDAGLVVTRTAAAAPRFRAELRLAAVRSQRLGAAP
jgi:two-component system sensor histidine kinase AlgZ